MPYDWINYFYTVGPSDPDNLIDGSTCTYQSTDNDYDGLL